MSTAVYGLTQEFFGYCKEEQPQLYSFQGVVYDSHLQVDGKSFFVGKSFPRRRDQPLKRGTLHQPYCFSPSDGSGSHCFGKGSGLEHTY